MQQIYPGDRVMVFDNTLFVNDVLTPLSVTMKPATVVRRYGQKVLYSICEDKPWVYPDLIDVEFDHRGFSRGHFTNRVKPL